MRYVKVKDIVNLVDMTCSDVSFTAVDEYGDMVWHGYATKIKPEHIDDLDNADVISIYATHDYEIELTIDGFDESWLED